MKIIEALDGKSIAMIITSVGGIVLAGMFGYFFFKTYSNDLQHVESAIDRQTEVQKETNIVLREQIIGLGENTKVLESLKSFIQLRNGSR